ncbi:uncharacterized protein LOC143229464 isoform X2 [Tachypleus tridentatus]
MYGDQRHSFVLQEEIGTRRLRYINLPPSPNFRSPKATHVRSNSRQQTFPHTVSLFPTDLDRKDPTSTPTNLETTLPEQSISTALNVEDRNKTEIPTTSSITTGVPETDISVTSSTNASEAMSSLDTTVNILHINETTVSPTGIEDEALFSQVFTYATATTSTSSEITMTDTIVSTSETTADSKTYNKTTKGDDVTIQPLYYEDTSELEGMINIINSNHLNAQTEEDEEWVSSPNRVGVNACLVTEEVVAPYWANNTRGETLALLNVYPFEQYVHWEKCVYENRQMHCRDGCRCEQQYRLHRLLAFDPKNECRGIFADWFRFPSSCVCICYDIPTDISKPSAKTGRWI